MSDTPQSAAERIAKPSQDELSDNDLMVLTTIVREADEVFQRVGGSSRHWVRDCFWPILNRDGLTLVRKSDTTALEAEVTALRAKNQRLKTALEKAYIFAGSKDVADYVLCSEIEALLAEEE